MNDSNTPDDPFCTPAPAVTQAESVKPDPARHADENTRHNAEGLAALRREITVHTLDAEGGDKSDPDRWTASARWSYLDLLALIRAAVWITHADGYGVGITEPETKALTSRNPEAIPQTARRIVCRLSEIVAAPDADAVAVSGSEALSGILPNTE